MKWGSSPWTGCEQISSSSYRSEDATPGSRACVRVLALLGRVGRAGLPGAFWCASRFPVAVLGALFVRLVPSWLGLPFLCFSPLFSMLRPRCLWLCVFLALGALGLGSVGLTLPFFFFFLSLPLLPWALAPLLRPSPIFFFFCSVLCCSVFPCSWASGWLPACRPLWGLGAPPPPSRSFVFCVFAVSLVLLCGAVVCGVVCFASCLVLCCPALASFWSLAVSRCCWLLCFFLPCSLCRAVGRGAGPRCCALCLLLCLRWAGLLAPCCAARCCAVSCCVVVVVFCCCALLCAVLFSSLLFLAFLWCPWLFPSAWCPTVLLLAVSHGCVAFSAALCRLVLCRAVVCLVVLCCVVCLVAALLSHLCPSARFCFALLCRWRCVVLSVLVLCFVAPLGRCCAVLCLRACVVLSRATLLCLSGTGWCPVLLPVVSGCWLPGLAVRCCPLVVCCGVDVLVGPPGPLPYRVVLLAAVSCPLVLCPVVLCCRVVLCFPALPRFFVTACACCFFLILKTPAKPAKMCFPFYFCFEKYNYTQPNAPASSKTM